MLILPSGHATEVQSLRRLSARERWLIRGVLAVLAGLAVGLVIALSSSSPTSARGCIHLTIPGPVGAQALDECGAEARTQCAVARRPGALAPGVVPQVLAACRQAGLPTR